ncbi:MAG: NAD-dependent epimerase/dehydratase family protein [Candidatus Wenzhouxiangella sp. M2_3B_020]
MRTVVTGASGLIGANVLRAAAASGHEAVGVARTGSRCDLADALGIPVVRADVLGASGDLGAAFEGAEAVIHTAAAFSYRMEPEKLRELAVRGTRAVLEAAVAAGVRRIVVTSSSVVFGHASSPTALSEAGGLADPADEPPYVAAKIAQDVEALALAEDLGLELVLACPAMSIGETTSALGPSNGLILAYLADATRSTYPGGCNIVSAEDVGAAHVLLAERGAPGKHYLLGSANLRWAEIHERIGHLTGVGGPSVELSPALARLAAGFEEMAAGLGGREPATTRHQAGMLGRYYWYDDSNARRLGYSPRPADEALARTISWLVASRHVSRELRAGIRLANEIHRLRHGRVAA